MDLYEAIHDLENEIFRAKMKKSTSLILHKLNIQLGHLRSQLKELKAPRSPVINRSGTVVNLYDGMGTVNLARKDSEKVMEKIKTRIAKAKAGSPGRTANLTAQEAPGESLKRTITKSALVLTTMPGIYVPTNIILDEIAKSSEKVPERVKMAHSRIPSRNPKEIVKMDKVMSSIPCVVQSKRKSEYTDRYAGVLTIGKGQ
jgi:hypothetical protein